MGSKDGGGGGKGGGRGGGGGGSKGGGGGGKGGGGSAKGGGGSTKGSGGGSGKSEGGSGSMKASGGDDSYILRAGFMAMKRKRMKLIISEMIAAMTLSWTNAKQLNDHAYIFCFSLNYAYDDHDFDGLNYMHMGAGKTWYGVPRDAAVVFEKYLTRCKS
ncbi:hypothetical protein Tco_1228924 [Tanacetum coccineum]